MKTILSYVLGAAMLLIAIPTLAQREKFVLKGQVKPQSAPIKIFLRYEVSYKNVIDSTLITDGKFEFKGEVNDITMAKLYTNSNGISTRGNLDTKSIFLQKGNSDFIAKDSLKYGKVKNSLNDEFETYTKKMLEVDSDLNKARSLKSHNLETRNANREKVKEAMAKKIDLQYKYIEENPQSYLSVYALNEIIMNKIEIDRVETAFNSLSKEVQNSKVGYSIDKIVKSEQLTRIGSTAKEFTQNDVNGKPVKLSDYRGQYVLVDFWASWCAPCRIENPYVVKAYNKYKDKNFTVLGISLDKENQRQAWLDAIKKDGLPWTNVSDFNGWKNEAAVLYGVRAVPSNFLIDPQGKIVAKNLREEALDKKLQEIIN